MTALPSACQSLLNAAKLAKRDYLARQTEHDELVEKMVAVVRATDPALADHYLAVAEHLAQDEEYLQQTGNSLSSVEE